MNGVNSNRCLKFFVKFDLQGHEFNFKLPDGKENYKTCTGGFCSIMLMIILLSYMITSGLEFQLREKYTIRKKEYEGIFLDSNYTFNGDNGFAVAASFWTPFSDRWDDPEIGELNFYIKYWQSSSEAVDFRKLSTRRCTNKDFIVPEGSDRSSYGFY